MLQMSGSFRTGLYGKKSVQALRILTKLLTGGLHRMKHFALFVFRNDTDMRSNYVRAEIHRQIQNTLRLLHFRGIDRLILEAVPAQITAQGRDFKTERSN